MELKDEKGRNIEETKLLFSLDVEPNSGTVNIKINLTQDYRKAKQLI